MALEPKFSIEVADAQANAACSLANAGWFCIYAGKKPDTADTPITNQVLLARLRFSEPAFNKAIKGVCTALPMLPDINATATGSASFFRVFKADGITPLWDGTVGKNSANFNMTATGIQQGARVEVTTPLVFSVSRG